MRTIVLGGTRFIGRAVVAELVAAGHDVLIVHRGEHEPAGLPRVPHLHAHRRDLVDHAEQLRRFRPAGIVDMSAMTRSDADTALAALPDGPRLVAVSSIDVYRAFSSVWAGSVTDPVPLTEESVVRDGPPPDRTYVMDGYDYDGAEYENLDVEAAYLARGGTVCRLPMVYGPHDFKHREEFVLRRVRAQRRRLPIGAGGFLCSRGYAPELARGIRLALEHPAAAGEVFNLCEGQCAPLRLWIEQIVEAADAELELVRAPDHGLPEDLEMTGEIAQPWLASPAKAKDVLGWVHRSPARCVRASVRWHMQHPPAESSTDFTADDEALALATTS
jgi:nucleoside-diphosphate-sugar epimerase